MKLKTITLLTALITYTAIKAQTPVYYENFENGIPSTFTVIDNDKRTPEITTWPKDSGWVVLKESTTNKAAASTSFYNPAGKADDWIILPPITIQAGNFLLWRSRAQHPGFKDGYEVKLSPTGGNKIADFTVNLLTVPEENEVWTNRALNLSAYAGKNITLAFRNTSTDKYVLFLDDIKLLTPTIRTDISITSTDLTEFSSQTSITIKGKLSNYGADTIKSLDINYKIDNGVTVTYSIPDLKEFIPLLFGNYNFTHTIPWSTTPGKHIVKLWADNINGKKDEVPANDTLIKQVIVAKASDLFVKTVLIEGFTSSTCPPCAAVNPILNKLLHHNKVNEPGSGIAAIKYQSNFPSPGNDPAYTAESGARRSYYAITGIPTSEINGGKFFAGHSSLINQKLLDSAKKERTPFNITLQTTYSDKSLKIDGEVKSGVELDNTNFRLFIALVEDSIVHNIQTNGEKKWYEVFRKFINTTGGTAFNGFKAQEAIPFTFEYTFDSNAPKLFSTLGQTHIVAFIQNYVTKEIYQTIVSKTTKSSGIGNIETETKFTIFPNPFIESTTLHYSLTQPEKVVWNVYNIIGEKVFSADEGVLNPGDYTSNFERNQLPAGLYVVSLKIGNKLFSKKLIIQTE